MAKPTEISIEEIRLAIIAKIHTGYKMTVEDFCKSPLAKKLKLNKHLPLYLSPSGSVSFPALSAAYEALGLGSLSKKEVRTTHYFTVAAKPEKQVAAPRGRKK